MRLVTDHPWQTEQCSFERSRAALENTERRMRHQFVCCGGISEADHLRGEIAIVMRSVDRGRFHEHRLHAMPRGVFARRDRHRRQQTADLLAAASGKNKQPVSGRIKIVYFSKCFAIAKFRALLFDTLDKRMSDKMRLRCAMLLV